MRPLDEEIFICLDCETTGLEPSKDRIIELAIIRFCGDEILDQFDTLIDPGVPIPPSSTAIHHIVDAMVAGKPKIEEVLPRIRAFAGTSTVIGHGIPFDLGILHHESERAQQESLWKTLPFIDTLRLARLYGESAENSLDKLRQHFNIQNEGAHRALSDVVVNMQVFRKLIQRFQTIQEIHKALGRPIQMRRMPLGKHKGRPFQELPLPYLQWAAHQNFDEDLLFSLRSELNRRRASPTFHQQGNPFQGLEGLSL